MKNYLLGLIVLGLSSTAFAKFSYEGYLMNPDGITPVTDSNVNIRLKIYDKLGTCLLYVEDHPTNMTGSGGYFSVVAGDGTSVTDYTGLGFGKIFSNAQTMNGSGSCPVTPAAGDQRKLDVSVSIAAAAFENFGAIDVFPTPNALVADNVGKFSPSHLLRVEDGGVPQIAAPLTSTNFTELQNLLGGSSTQYMKASGGMTSVPTGTGSGATAGSLWYDGGVLKYHNGSGAVTLSTGGAGITSLTGDVTGTGPGAVAATIAASAVTTGKIAPNAVDFSKMQYINTNRILGRSTAATGPIEELSLGGGLSLSGGVLSASGGADASYAIKGIVQFDTDSATSGINVTSGVAKLATSGVTSGTYGSTSSAPVVSVDAFGRVVSISTNPIDMGAITTGILSTMRGGTGSASLAANRMVMMNGIGTAMISDSCGVGEVLRYNGVLWACATMSGGDFMADGTVSMTGGVKAISGSSSSPAYGFSATSTTGMYSPLANAIGFSTNGIERVRIDSSGNVGIGTNAPSSRLALSNSGMSNPTIIAVKNDMSFNSDIALTNASDTGMHIAYNQTIPGLEIGSVNSGVNGAAQFVIQRISGNVGIGMMAPVAPLHVALPASGVGKIYVDGNGPGSTGFGAFIARQAQGTPIAPTATQSGDIIAKFGAAGHDGAMYNESATIKMIATQNHSGAGRGTSMSFGTIANGSLAMIERMVINEIGNVGIGYNTPSAALHLRASSPAAGTASLKMTAGTLLTTPEAGAIEFDGNFLYFTNSGATRRTLAYDGYSPTFNSGTFSSGLTVGGNITPISDGTQNLGSGGARFNYVYAVNGTIQTSDRRQKRQIQNSDLGLDFINNLRPVSYYWKSGDKKLHYGVIAQELEQTIRQFKTAAGRGHEVDNVIVNHDDKTDAYGVKYSELISPMIKAIQELYNKYLAQDAEIAQLKQENKAIKAYLCARDASAEICGN